MRFKKPEAYQSENLTLPVSIRLKPEVLTALDKAAKRSKLSRSELIAGILKDYAEWLKTQS